VLNINGKEVKSVKDVLNEIGLEVGKSLDITVRRREDVLKLTFTTASEVSRSS
jgi:C-terminal processing protease CtpA/Prc